MKFTAKPTTWYSLDLGNGFVFDRCTREDEHLVTVWQGLLMKDEKPVPTSDGLQYIVTLAKPLGFSSFVEEILGSVRVDDYNLPILAASNETAEAIMYTVKKEAESEGEEVDTETLKERKPKADDVEGEEKKRMMDAKARHRRT